MFEVILFGYEKGFFIGVIVVQFGKFELVDGGIIFFDEILEMFFGLQVKLLCVLQECEVEWVGVCKLINLDICVFVMINCDFVVEVVVGCFCEDFYYCLLVFLLVWWLLCECFVDILLLVECLLCKYSCKMNFGVVVFGFEVVQCLVWYVWLGNVWEFDNVIQCVLIL